MVGFMLGEPVRDSRTAANRPSSGIDPQAASDFMRAVVPQPSEGQYLSIHTLFKQAGRPSAMPGSGFTSYDDAANHFAYWLNRKPQDMFFCLSTQNKLKVPEAGKPVPRHPRVDRHQSNVAEIRVLFTDLDVKEGAYPTQADAMRALMALVSDGRIPTPTAWVNSGYGVHVYWILDRGYTHAEWHPVAMGFGNFRTQHGIKEDRFWADSARVLRAPGTLNCKDPENPRPVTLIGKVNPHRYTLADFAKYVGTPAVTQQKTLAAGGPTAPALRVVTGGKQSGQDRIPGGAVAGLLGKSMADVVGLNNRMPLPAGYEQGSSELSNGVNTEGAVADMATTAQHCLAIADVLERGGEGDAEPFWRHMLYTASFAPDGREWAHAFSKGHASYNEGETDSKFDTVLRQRESSNGKMGWPSCGKFSEFSAKCQECPFKDRIFSPFNIPKSMRIQATTVVPEGYEFNNGAYWKVKVDLTDNGTGDEERIPVFFDYLLG